MGSKGKPYRTTVVDGFEILVGRGAVENDQLTFGVGEPADFWLHVGGGTPGSHVVVRNPEGVSVLPARVLEHAAALAAWHSKARGRKRVQVHLCRVADVGKRRGAPDGEVVLRDWTPVKVEADRVAELVAAGSDPPTEAVPEA